MAKANKVPVVYLASDDSRIPESVRASVESGDIRASMSTVKVKIKGKKDPASGPYLRLEARTMPGALVLTNGRLNCKEAGEKGNGVLDEFNYGLDLGVRAEVRGKILQTLEGPEAAIRRGIKGLLACGLPEAKAKRVIIEQMVEEGKLEAGYELPADFSLTAKK